MDATTTYDYPAAGAAKPHTLIGTTTVTSSGTSGTAYSYDQAGNTTGRTLPGGGQTLLWNQENKLAKVTTAVGETSYVYDGDGNQLIRRDHGKTTLFLPGQELTREAGTGVVTGTRRYSHDGKTVAMRVGNANPKYVVSDRHGTATVVFDSVSHVVTRRTMDPYGNPTDPVSLTAYGNGNGNGNPVTNEDPTGLIIGNNRPDGVTGPKRVPATPPSMPAAPFAPTVQNQELQKITNASYLREDVTPEVGNGSTADALRYELQTGNQIKGKWHFLKAAIQADRLGGWLKKVRDGEMVASPEDIEKANSVAKGHWDALTRPDGAGKLTDHIKSLAAEKHQTFKDYRKAINNIEGSCGAVMKLPIFLTTL